jgi:hypothetical protein
VLMKRANLVKFRNERLHLNSVTVKIFQFIRSCFACINFGWVPFLLISAKILYVYISHENASFVCIAWWMKIQIWVMLRSGEWCSHDLILDSYIAHSWSLSRFTKSYFLEMRHMEEMVDVIWNNAEIQC